jgi:pectate lyase
MNVRRCCFVVCSALLLSFYGCKINSDNSTAGDGDAVYDIVVVPGASVTTNGWADMANSGSGMSYPNTTNIIVINDTTYTTAVAKRQAFTNAIASGNVTSSTVSGTAAIIILDGTVDLSDGVISDSDHTYFDSFNSSTHKRTHVDIVYQIGSNKTIIGVNSAKVEFGGLQVSATSSTTGQNIIIRNINFWDAHGSTEYDTSVSEYSSSKASIDQLGFEATFNSNVATYMPKNIWIDHCKFSDGTCSDLERNYNHDGSLDFKAAQNVTVSYCEFTNHDKITLLAPGETYTTVTDREITFHHNYYHDAIQRMPRARGCEVHVYNNYYNVIGNSANAGYSLGPGINSQFIVENTYFGTHQSSIMKYFDGSATGASTFSHIYASGNSPALSDSNTTYDSSTEGTVRTSSLYTVHAVSSKPWTPGYKYTLDSVSVLPATIPASAGPDISGYSKTVRVNGIAYN